MIPKANRPRMMAIGLTFFFRSLQHSSVRPIAARPGISWSRFCCSVVTFTWSSAVAPIELYCVSASLMPSEPAGSLAQSM